MSFLSDGQQDQGWVLLLPMQHSQVPSPVHSQGFAWAAVVGGGTTWPGKKHFLNHLATPAPDLICHGTEKGEDSENMMKA